MMTPAAREPLVAETFDIDADGHDEIWIHSGDFSAIVSPRRGGAVEELTRFATGINYADVLTRRLEAYHLAALRPADASAHEGGTASIHDIERSLHMAEMPPVDRHDRAVFRERLLDGDTTPESYARAEYAPIRSWEAEPLGVELSVSGESAIVALAAPDGSLRKTLRFTSRGEVVVGYEWHAPSDGRAVFAAELSLFRPLPVGSTPDAEVWRYPVETVSKSERGLDRTVQGESITLRWPASLGHATVTLGSS